MRLAVVLFLAASPCSDAFVTQPSFKRLNNGISRPTRSVQQLSMVDPSFFHDLPNHVDSFQNSFASMLLSQDAVADAVSSVVDNVDPDNLAEASGNGWFGFLAGPIEYLLQVIHASLNTVGFSTNSWGVSIVFMTVVIKLLTYPLTKSQLESTNKMTAIQPAVKELQAKYASNPEVMNQKVAEFYQNNDVNPLAGCVPSLVQIPVFIGLYRAVLGLAKDNALSEPFLWLPNLEGPVYGADPSHGSDWIMKGWVDGVPSLGWHDTALFLSIPVFLVISQSISTQLMQPKTAEGAPQQNNLILKLLPLMIGWFSLNVPSALGIYWVANNLITTAISLQIRNSFENKPMESSAAAPVAPPKPVGTFTPAPQREKPAGFNAPVRNSNEVTTITAIDAEVVKTKPAKTEVKIVDAEEVVGSAEPTSEAKPTPKRKKGGKGKKKKRN